MPSTLQWGFLNEITHPEAASPAGFFRRKLSTESASVFEAGLKAGEDGRPKTSESGQRPRSPRIAEALRRRKMRRASTDQGAGVKAAAEAARLAAGQEEILEQQRASTMSAAAAGAAVCQEKVSSEIKAMKGELKSRLYLIEQKLDALITAAEEQQEWCQQQHQQQQQQQHHHHQQQHQHQHQHQQVSACDHSTASADVHAIHGKRRPLSARGHRDPGLSEPAPARGGLRKSGSMLVRQMLERQTSDPPGSPKASSSRPSSNNMTESDDISRFSRRMGSKSRQKVMPDLRLPRVDSCKSYDEGEDLGSAPLPAAVPPSPAGAPAGLPLSPTSSTTPEAPPGQPAWMETATAEKPQKHVRMTIEVEPPPSRRGSVATIEGRSNARTRRDSWASSISSSSAEMLRAKMRAMGNKRTERQQAVWHFMEEAESSPGAMAFHWLMNIIVTVNVFFCTIQTTDPPTLSGALPVLLHFIFDIFFTLEVIVRFIVCPNRCTFFLQPANWVDMIAAVPLIMNIIQCATEDCERGQVMEVAMVILPVLRLCKLLRSFEKFHLLLNAFELAFEALPVLLYSLSVLVLFFAAVIYFAEPRANIATLPQSVWLVITTMMTVGYGDVMPRTTSGLICTSFLIISSALYMAIPLGIVGGAFSRVWEDRDRLMLIRRTRNRLQQWGYTPKDILELFYLYDHDKSGELDLGEFSEMIEEMRLGIGEERVANLFKTFDSDGSGKVDDEEFVRALYPKGYASIYQFHAMTNEIIAFTGFGKRSSMEGDQRDHSTTIPGPEETNDEPGATPIATPTSREDASPGEASTRTPTPGNVCPDFDSPSHDTKKRLSRISQASGLPGMSPLPGMNAPREDNSESSELDSEVPKYWSSGPVFALNGQTSS